MTEKRGGGEAFYITAAGVSTYVERAGHGPATVLIHPLGGSTRSWRGIREGLDGIGEVVSYDWGGHGFSELPAGEGRMTDYAVVLVDLIRRLRLAPARLVGVAAGAGIALQAALESAESVSGLVLVSPCAKVGPDAAAGMAARAAQVRAEGMRVAVDASVAAGFSAAYRASDPEAVETYRHEFLANKPESYARASDAFGRFDVEARLGGISVPCTLLPGEIDPYFPPENAYAMAERLPSAHVRVLAGTAHFGHIERPRLVLEAIADTATAP